MGDRLSDDGKGPIVAAFEMMKRVEKSEAYGNFLLTMID
jgi:hypothetical protein